MPVITELSAIPGVLLIDLQPFADTRGRFTETFRKEWFPMRRWDRVQSNRSDSQAGVLRGLHYHFDQVDYWYLAGGSIRVGLADLRRSSAAFRQTETIDLDAGQNRGLYIPSGVAHGFLALTDVTLFYTVDNYYDGGRDEFGLAWDDLDVLVDWRAETLPIVSGRDAGNPRFRDIAFDSLPQ